MLCPRPVLLNPGAAPAVLPQARHKHPSAQRFVQRPIAGHSGPVFRSPKAAIRPRGWLRLS